AAVTPFGELATEVFTATTGVGVTTDDLTRELQQMWLQVPHQSIRAGGVGITGVVRQQSLTASDFLPRLVAHDLPALFSAALGNIPVKIENDARCFLLAEARFGAGRGARNACGITLGTGAGGAVMVNGELITGANAEAGEVWRIPCRDSFLEYFVSGAGLVRGYQAAGGNADETITAADIAVRARAGERAALQAWESYGNDVYALCETMIALLEPEVIILGGSMAQAHDLFGAQFKEKLAGRASRIALAELDAAAGLIGAAALHFG
ncbi:MAG: ROK family protein, partial [Acidobacteria bacterium]|nr:ROK family protein [Acidobacteriota bacterium]